MWSCNCDNGSAASSAADTPFSRDRKSQQTGYKHTCLHGYTNMHLKAVLADRIQRQCQKFNCYNSGSFELQTFTPDKPVDAAVPF